MSVISVPHITSFLHAFQLMRNNLCLDYTHSFVFLDSHVIWKCNNADNHGQYPSRRDMRHMSLHLALGCIPFVSISRSTTGQCARARECGPYMPLVLQLYETRFQVPSSRPISELVLEVVLFLLLIVFHLTDHLILGRHGIVRRGIRRISRCVHPLGAIGVYMPEPALPIVVVYAEWSAWAVGTFPDGHQR